MGVKESLLGNSQPSQSYNLECKDPDNPTAEEISAHISKRMAQAMDKFIGQPLTTTCIEVAKSYIQGILKDYQMMGLISEVPELHCSYDAISGKLWVEDLAAYLKRTRK